MTASKPRVAKMMTVVGANALAGKRAPVTFGWREQDPVPRQARNKAPLSRILLPTCKIPK